MPDPERRLPEEAASLERRLEELREADDPDPSPARDALDHEEPLVRAAAFGAHTRVGVPVPGRARDARATDAAVVQAAATTHLVALGERDLLDEARSFATHDDAEVRRYGVMAFQAVAEADLDDEGATPLDADDAAALATALASSDASAAAEQEAGERALEAIRGASFDPPLSEVAEVVPPLATAAREAPDPSVRYRAVSALEATGNPDSIPALVDRLDDDAARVRRHAAEKLALFDVDDGAFAEAMLAREAAYRTLADFDGRPDERAVEALLGALDDGDEEVREMAAKGLGFHAADEAAPALVAKLESDDVPAVRAAAARALGRVGAGEDALYEAVRDPEPEVRAGVARALGRPPEVPVDVLLAAADDEDATVREAAVLSLGESDDPRAERRVLNAVQDDDASVRRAAARRGSLDPTAERVLRVLFLPADAAMRGYRVATGNAGATLSFGVELLVVLGFYGALLGGAVAFVVF